MERLTYLLDTNAIADYLNGIQSTKARIENAILSEQALCLAQPVHYEVSRGLLKVGAARKLSVFREVFTPQLDWISVTDDDWNQAAELWAKLTRIGKQLSDIDYLLAALALRLNAVIISADNDFDALPVKRENWRI